MRKRIIVLDSAGMAGHMIKKHLESFDDFEVIGVVFEKENSNYGHFLCLDNFSNIIKFIDSHKPDIVINTVRILVEESSLNPSEAILINSYLPRLLEKVYLHTSTKIIHLSTDCVFSGKTGGYVETSIKDGKDMYSKSRAMGEIVNDKDLTIRTSFIGPVLIDKNEELFDWFLTKKGEVNGYVNAFWTGVSTLELAINLEKAIRLDITGVYHLVPEEKINKFILLKLLKDIWGKKDIKLNRYENKNIDKSLIDTRRLLYTGSYDKMFQELKVYMDENRKLYSKYY